MHTETIPLVAASPGVQHNLQVLHFGQPGRGPKAMIQAALHADEVPAMLVARYLRVLLAELEAAGRLLGEVVLVPCANPLGLAQQLLGQHHGRFDLHDGINFNRNVPDLSAAVAQALEGRLGSDPAANVVLVRGALREAAADLSTVPALQPADDLKRQLLRLAVDADTVLDLHCDGQAAMHLYGLTPQADLCAELGALLGARAVLLATESGDSPFDEACSRPWLVLQQRHPQHALPLACFSSTVELRGEADTGHALAQQDALALVEFLRRRGVVAGTPAPLPTPLCQPTPLAGSEPVTAHRAGVVVFHHAVGADIQAGDVVADLVDVGDGSIHPVLARTSGVLYARVATRWATAGKRLAKIAGVPALRSGKLLSP